MTTATIATRSFTPTLRRDALGTNINVGLATEFNCAIGIDAYPYSGLLSFPYNLVGTYTDTSSTWGMRAYLLDTSFSAATETVDWNAYATPTATLLQSQFISARLAAQTIPLGSWIADGLQTFLDDQGAGLGFNAQLLVALINGQTLGVRSMICQPTISSKFATTDSLVNTPILMRGESVEVQSGDFLAVELSFIYPGRLAPIQTLCCVNKIPSVLYAHISNDSHCACYDGTPTILVAYNTVLQRWEGNGTGCSRPLDVSFFCASGGASCADFGMSMRIDSTATTSSLNSCACETYEWDFYVFTTEEVGLGCFGGLPHRIHVVINSTP